MASIKKANKSKKNALAQAKKNKWWVMRELAKYSMTQSKFKYNPCTPQGARVYLTQGERHVGYSQTHVPQKNQVSVSNWDVAKAAVKAIGEEKVLKYYFLEF